MPESIYQYWSGATEFIDADARRLLPKMIDVDDANRKALSSNRQEALKVLDSALSLYIHVLQKLYKIRNRWENASNSKAAIAMANSAINYHLLARHAVILGYLSEAEPIHRACFERMTRCAVFQLNRDLADRFWAGEQIPQSQIRDLLSKHFEKNVAGTGKLANEANKNMYKSLSNMSHPNLDILKFRTVKPKDKSAGVIGIDYSYCCEPNEHAALMAIGESLTYLIFSLFMLRIVCKEILGAWANVLGQKIEKLFIEDNALLLHMWGEIRPYLNNQHE